MKYSICCAAWKDAEPLRRLLASIELFPPDSTYELCLAADSFEKAKDRKWFASLAQRPNVIVHYFHKRISYAIKQNVNIACASGDYIVLCDHDIEFIHKNWAERMLTALTDDVAAVSAKAMGKATTTKRQWVPESWNPDACIGRRRSTQSLAGYCMMARKSVFDWNSAEYIGFLDTFAPSVYSDRDWCRRARLSGKRLTVCFSAVVRHSGDQFAPWGGKREYRNARRPWERNFKRKWEMLRAAAKS